MDADIVELHPKPGTLAWLSTHDLIARGADMLPSCHRVPEDALLLPADEDKRCRVEYASGERCKGTRTLAYGICMGHLGAGGASDPAAMSAKGVAKLKELRVTREVLGIGPRSAGNPRAAARLLAAQRANELASAIVDGPLDADLDAVTRQRAALAALDATFPQQTASMTLEIGDPEEMSWKDMQALASSLIG